MMKYIKARLGERTTLFGTVGSVAVLVASFFVPSERGDIASVMQQLAIPIFLACFLWEEKT